MGTINYLQRKNPLASTPTTSAPSLLRPSRPFAPLSPSPSEQDLPAKQAQLQHARPLEYSFDRIPIFPPAKKNNTGLPDTLKAGIEGISGISMDDVQVNYHSSKPAQMQALAYTQGADIHVGPGQEQHLPHEAWHVVQQKQGRVVPTLQASGVAINDDEGLEREADNIGKSLAGLGQDRNGHSWVPEVTQIIPAGGRSERNPAVDRRFRPGAVQVRQAWVAQVRVAAGESPRWASSRAS